MALSNKLGSIVLTTGNKSEMAVGYATLYGDMAGGFGVLKDISKTLVYRLCAYRNGLGRVIPERIITRPPSAELRPDQVDQDSLPPYDALDAILEAYVEHDKSPADIVAMGYAPSMCGGSSSSSRSTNTSGGRLPWASASPHAGSAVTGAIPSRRRGMNGRVSLPKGVLPSFMGVSVRRTKGPSDPTLALHRVSYPGRRAAGRRTPPP
jgi:hypothetical protein